MAGGSGYWLIEETRPSNRKQLRRSGANYTMDWEDYHPHEVLNEFIEALADANDFGRIVNIGQSYEGREMKVLALEKVRPSRYEGKTTLTTHICRLDLPLTSLFISIYWFTGLVWLLNS